MNGSAVKMTACLGLLLAMAAWPSAQDERATSPIRGFSPRSVVAERAAERRLRDELSVDSIQTWHRYFTAKPHPATSPRTREIANYIAEQWKAQGLDGVVIHRYDVLSSNPRTIQRRARRTDALRPIVARGSDVQEDRDSFQAAISGGGCRSPRLAM